jgi:precorrin-2 dehydrogenase / sirohydrochlorin ferrochelatase
MLELQGKRCVVIGGGQIGERKTEALLEAGASVTVVSPQLTEQLLSYAADGRLSWVPREYASEALRGAFIVIAATNHPKVNRQIYSDLIQSEACSLYDIVDCPELSSFIMPAVVRRGRLVLSVSTSGAGPQLAKDIRHRLSLEYGEEYEHYLDFLFEYRTMVRRLVADPGERKRLLSDILQLNALEQLRECAPEAWEEWKSAQFEQLIRLVTGHAGQE